MKKNLILILFLILSFQFVIGQDCISIDCSELAKSINEFRKTNAKQELQLSFTLCSAAAQMANALQDKIDKPYLSPEMYSAEHKMINVMIRGLDANSKNTINTFTMRHPALDLWKVILEEESFSGKNWKSLGVGLYKNYAVLWFSDKELNDKPKVCGGQQLNVQTEIIIQHKDELPAIENGKWLVPPTYFKMCYLNFEPELFPVANDSEKWGYINKNGEVLIPFQFETAYAFTEGLAGVKIDGGKLGYINLNGEFEIPASYAYGSYFHNGTALVLDKEVNYLINTKGEKISDESSDMDFFNEKWVAYKKGGLYGIKDLSGKIVKAPFCTDFMGYSEGLAAVKIQGKWCFMDESLNLVIKTPYTEKLIYAFHDGVARFKQNGKVGVIDKTGKVLIPAKYQDLYEFSEGLAAFQENGKWGYINLEEEVLIEPEYLSAFNFKYGMAKVKDSNLKSHLIDPQNKQIIKDVHDIIVFSNKLIGVYAKGGWGIVELKR